MHNHSTLETALRRLVNGQLDTVGMVRIHRLGDRDWSIAGGPPVSLLVAVDQLAALLDVKAVPGLVRSSYILPSKPPPRQHHMPHREFLSHGHSRNASLTRSAREAPRPERALDRPWE
jgi:hypothetical protein